jgi:Na+-driven multidrug efflux pump
MINTAQNSNKRIVLNSIALYLKMFFSIIVALFTTRIVLSAFGVVDYGIYTLVIGVVSLLTFLNVSMTLATQRFMSIAIGQGNMDRLKKVFETSVFLHLIIGVIIVLGLEIGGIFLFDGFLDIPASRIDAAKIIYQFMIVSTFFTINAVPYDAAIVANEQMLVDSAIGFLENILKLLIAFYLLHTTQDKLILYSFLSTILLIFIRIVKSFYCRKKYEECQISYAFWKLGDKSEMKEMAAFAGWNTFGSLVFVGRSQLLSVVLNLFFGTVINAAYGVANQVNAQIAILSTTLLKALNPQLTKSEGRGDRMRMLRIAEYSTKFSFFVFSLFLIPLYVEIPFLFKLWLKTVPEHTINFSILLLSANLVKQLSNGIMLSMQSIGKLKNYTLIVNTIYLLNVPLSALCLYYGYPVYYAIIMTIVTEFFGLGARIIIANIYIEQFSLKEFLFEIILKSFIIFGLTVVPVYFLSTIMEDNFFRLIVVSLFSSVLMLVLIYNISLRRSEKERIKELVREKLIYYKIL